MSFENKFHDDLTIAPELIKDSRQMDGVCRHVELMKMQLGKQVDPGDWLDNFYTLVGDELERRRKERMKLRNRLRPYLERVRPVARWLYLSGFLPLARFLGRKATVFATKCRDTATKTLARWEKRRA